MTQTIPGAVPIGALDPDHPDADLIAHYGDPVREQRTLATAVGLVDRGNRGVLTVSGPERLSWLHSFTSQHLQALAPGRGTEALILSPHGHVEHHAVLLDDGTTSWLDVEPGSAPALLEFLLRMRFMSQVEPADATADWAVLSLLGPSIMEPLARLGVPSLAEPDVVAVPGPKFAAGSVPPRSTSGYPSTALPAGGFARRMPYGVDLVVPRPDVASVIATAGVPLAGQWAFEALRVADRRPRLGFDTDHRTLPSEVNLVGPAVHLEKGCYRGQETVARVHNLGKPPRRLVLLHLDGIVTDELPPPQTPVTRDDDRPVGFVGTAVRHYELGMIALAVLKRSLPDDTKLLVGPSAAAIDPE